MAHIWKKAVITPYLYPLPPSIKLNTRLSYIDTCIHFFLYLILFQGPTYF